MKSKTEQMSWLTPGPQFAGAPAVQEVSAERRWGSETQAHYSLRPPFVAVRTVQVGRAPEVGALFASTAICGGEDSSSGEGYDETELGVRAGEEWSGDRKSVLVVAVG